MASDQPPNAANTPGRPAQPRSSAVPMIVILMIAALVIGVSVLLPRLRERRTYAPREHPAVGKSLRKLKLQPLTGTNQPLSSADQRDRVMLINFWGTWCPPCRDEMPHLVKLYRTMRKEARFLFVSVSCDDSSELGELKKKTDDYLKRYQFEDLPTYADLNATTRKQMARVAGFTTTFPYPTTLVIDEGGVIRGVWTGTGKRGAEAAVLEQQELVEELLKP